MEDEQLQAMANDMTSWFTFGFHNSSEKENSFLRKMSYMQLGNTKMYLSLMSYGGSSLGNVYSDNAQHQETIETIQLALKSGVNYIDTAPWYEPSEQILGEALVGVPRKAYYIGTKVGRYKTRDVTKRFDFNGLRVYKSIQTSLDMLQCQYIDLIQIHDIEFCLDQDMLFKETLPALHLAMGSGYVKHVGITSYSLKALQEFIEKLENRTPKIPVQIESVLSYCRYNFHDKSLDSYARYFTDKGIGVINASPLGMGLYTQRGPPDWHPASPELRAVVRDAGDFTRAKNISIEHAALGFGLRPKNLNVTTTLVSLPTKQMLNENLNIATTPYTAEDDALYKSIENRITEGLREAGVPGHWDGVEVEKYQRDYLAAKAAAGQ